MHGLEFFRVYQRLNSTFAAIGGNNIKLLQWPPAGVESEIGTEISNPNKSGGRGLQNINARVCHVRVSFIKCL